MNTASLCWWIATFLFLLQLIQILFINDDFYLFLFSLRHLWSFDSSRRGELFHLNHQLLFVFLFFIFPLLKPFSVIWRGNAAKNESESRISELKKLRRQRIAEFVSQMPQNMRLILENFWRPAVLLKVSVRSKLSNEELQKSEGEEFIFQIYRFSFFCSLLRPFFPLFFQMAVMILLMARITFCSWRHFERMEMIPCCYTEAKQLKRRRNQVRVV